MITLKLLQATILSTLSAKSETQRLVAGVLDYDTKNRELKLDNKGFALVETIAALAILSFVLVGLMIMVQYAHARAVANYHDRYVLLRVDGELQKIRNYYHLHGRSFPTLSPVIFEIPQLNMPTGVLGTTVRTTTVTIYFHRTFHFDESVGIDVGYNSIMASAEWDESIPFVFGRRVRPERRHLQLREDYFMRRRGL